MYKTGIFKRYSMFALSQKYVWSGYVRTIYIQITYITRKMLYVQVYDFQGNFSIILVQLKLFTDYFIKLFIRVFIEISIFLLVRKLAFRCR